jgi:hypothetical protein
LRPQINGWRLAAHTPRRWAIALAICAGALAPVAAAPTAACAGESPRAALVVDTGDSSFRYCVELDDESVSGIELITLAGEQHDLSYHLGFGGQAVCMLAGVGPTGDDCFAGYPDFWGYWRGDGSDGWTWSSSGAGSTTVEDGDVEGWAWGSGDGPDEHPMPPHTEFDDVCRQKPAPEEAEPEPSPQPSPSPQPGPTTPSASREREQTPEYGREKRRDERPGPSREPPQERDRRWYEGRLVAEIPPLALPSPTATPTPTVAATPQDLAAEPSSDDGPPPAGIAALLASVALIGGGAILIRRRA